MHYGCPRPGSVASPTVRPTRFVIIGGRHAAELISIVALAVTAGLTVHDIQESLFVHPTLAEALADAAE